MRPTDSAIIIGIIKPGSPLDPVAEGANPLPPEAQKNLAKAYGLDRPVYQQFLIFVGMAMSVQARFTPTDYFQVPYQLFPTWPEVDPELELQLLAFTAVLLLGPKFMGLATMLGDANAYMEIFNANRDQLSDPDKIKPGQVLKIPQTTRR